jgi:hypothetical protein
MRLLPELGLLRSDPLFDRSYPKSGSELTETRRFFGTLVFDGVRPTPEPSLRYMDMDSSMDRSMDSQ